MEVLYEYLFYACLFFTALAAFVLMVSIDKKVPRKEVMFKGSFIFRDLDKYVRKDRIKVVRLTTNTAIIIWFLSLGLILFQGVAAR